MTIFRKLAVATSAVALLAASATPALARPYGGWGGHGGYHGGWHHHGNGVGGALVGGLLVGGLVAAVASSSRDRGPVRYAESGSFADRAVDACAGAVENDRGGRVREISSAGPYAGGWQVQGVVDVPAGRPDSFSCSIRGGQVDDIRYGSEYAPRR